VTTLRCMDGTGPGFYPYNPRGLRTALVLCALACAALAAWALADARMTGQVTAFARAGLALGLLGAFAWVFWRVRPRAGWGVQVGPLGLRVSRPLSGEPLELAWSQVQEVRREGRRRERLLIRLQPDGRILLQRLLFPSASQFQSLCERVQQGLPAPTWDA
jgi:hypothetical protein